MVSRSKIETFFIIEKEKYFPPEGIEKYDFKGEHKSFNWKKIK